MSGDARKLGRKGAPGGRARAGLAGLCLLMLGACGFHPVYAPDQHTSAALNTVSVSVIPNRNGQELREALQLRMDVGGSSGSKRLVLDVSYVVGSSGLSIQADNASTRARLTADATWRLHSVEDPKTTLATGRARALDGYNILNSQFFYADLSDQAAQRRLADQIAEQITERLAIFLRDHPDLG